MPEKKQIIGNVLVALIVFLLTASFTGIFRQNKKINESVSQKELAEESKKIKKECSDHLSEVMSAHEKIHDETKVQFVQIQTDLNIIKKALIEK